MYSSALDLHRIRNKKNSENSIFITKTVWLLQKKKKGIWPFLASESFCNFILLVWGRVGVWLIKNSRYNTDKQN